jgi:Zn-dependent M28 family amino/carboxypeptidase
MTGQDGVLLFNGTVRPNEAAIVQKINEENQYMKNVENRDPLPQSDHHPFHAKGVPAIFFLTKGASGRGHTPDDTYDKLPLYAYENFFKLVTEIPDELRKQEVR